MKKNSFILISILIFILGLSGCGSKSTSRTVEKGNDIKQEIVANLAGEPYTLDPAFASDTTSFWVIDNLYEGLYRYHKKGNVVEGVASKVNVSKDGKTYTFTIRDGLKWSNGDDLTANDFEFAWKRVLDPKTAGYEPSSIYYI